MAIAVFSLSFLALIPLLAVLLMGRKKHQNLRMPPGPRGVPLLGILPFMNNQFHKYVADLAKKHGPVMTIYLGLKQCIVVSSPEAAGEVLKEQDSVFANRDFRAVYLSTMNGGQDILWSPQGPHARMLRKSVVRGLTSNSSVEAMSPLRRRRMRKLVAELYEKQDQPVTIREIVFESTLDILTNAMWGEEASQVVKKEFREAVEDTVVCMGHPNVSDFFPALAPLDLQGINRRMRRAMERFSAVFQKILEVRKKAKANAEGPAVKDFLELMIGILDDTEMNPQNPITMEHIKALLGDIIQAGTHTTAVTVEWLLSELILSPEKMKKVKDELDEKVGRSRTIEESDLRNLVYLQACLKESFRRHPIGPLLIPRTPSKNTKIFGYDIPAGSCIMVNCYGIQMDSAIWDKPDEFIPERFLETKEAFDYQGRNFKYFPFGSGRRMCAGTYMGETTVLITIANMLHGFDWNLPAGHKIDLNDKFLLDLIKAEPLLPVPHPRLGSPELYN